MRARHVTSEEEYRSPFGAVQLGGTVMLAIDAWGDDVASCILRVWTDAQGEELVEMIGAGCGDHLRFSARYTPAATGIVWYSFEIGARDGSLWRYGAKQGWTTGEGAFAFGDPPSFQITVYVPREPQPWWYREGIVYQIFPDRFARGSDWRACVARSFAEAKNSADRRLVADWDTPPTYTRREDKSIATWDFYGGTLQGIRENLAYLANLGVTVIYLNPIFEATSNHRYDTGDYLRIDPMLGTEEDFVSLVRDAGARGISVILDGVFNHCGSDSRYFNRYGTYPEVGAYQSVDSPWRSWFSFAEDGTYDGWWGNPDMPALDESDPAYHELVCGTDGIVRRWLRAGARGWRIDVADELTDGFLVDIKRAALAERPDAVLVGEVWEDASNKISYGKLRQYFEGDELDATMNYPLRTALLAFMRNEIFAPEVAARLEQLRENYPRDNFYSALNLLGSHDRERLFTMLGGAPDPDTLDEAQREAFILSDEQASLAMSRLWAIVLLQMSLPGVPCVYYGDELGLEGFRDPHNRATKPWDASRGHKDCTTIYRNAIALRKTLPLLVDGEFEPFAVGDDVFGFWRWTPDRDKGVCVLVNSSLGNARTIGVPCPPAAQATDVISGRPPKVGAGTAEVFLWPLGTSMLYLGPKVRLQRPLEWGMGVLCHITSVPNEGRPGTLGAPARRFVDWLAAAGQRYWQVLPVNPADEFGSPYAGLAAFAGNTRLLERPENEVLDALADIGDDARYQCFCEENNSWLAPYATFRAIKRLLGEVAWQMWPEDYRTWRPELASAPELAGAFEEERRLQFEFDWEWRELHDYARARGISIIGDMPMYVSADSADVWADPSIFDLDESGYPNGQAGAPGDMFAPEGQLWGNPTYRWDVLRERGYGWWLRRFGRALALYDYVRLDHFIGFSSYYTVPKGKAASEGSYAFGPGLDLFEAAWREFGPLPFIAEDLGNITPAVRALVAATGIPGMDVIQFADGDVRERFEPHVGAVVYTGTHDNQTLVGFCERAYDLVGEEASEMADTLMGNVLGSDADVAMVQLQDVLGLDDEARMNVPGVPEGNWSWQADEADVEAAADRLRELARRYVRCSAKNASTTDQ